MFKTASVSQGVPVAGTRTCWNKRQNMFHLYGSVFLGEGVVQTISAVVLVAGGGLKQKNTIQSQI